MNRLPQRIMNYMAALAPVGRERTLNRRPARDDMVELTTTETTLLIDKNWQVEGGHDVQRQPRFEGFKTSLDLSRLVQIDRMHRHESLVRVGWLFLKGNGVGGSRVWTPLVTVKTHLDEGLRNTSVLLIGEWEVTPGLFSDEVRFRLQRDLESTVLEKLAWLNQISDIYADESGVATTWALEAARHLGIGDARAVSTHGKASDKSDVLHIDNTMAVYLDRNPITATDVGSTIKSWAAFDLAGTALDALYNPTDPPPPSTDRVSAALPLNMQQAELVQTARTAPITVVSGPPGTGKTHAAVAMAEDLVARNQSVLIAASSDHAIDSIVRMLEQHPSPRWIRFGSREHRERVADFLSGGIPAHTSSSYNDAHQRLVRTREQIAEIERTLTRMARAEEIFDYRLDVPTYTTQTQADPAVITQAERLLLEVGRIRGLFAGWRINGRLANARKLLGVDGDLETLWRVLTEAQAEIDAEEMTRVGARFASTFDRLEHAEADERATVEAIGSYVRPISMDGRRSLGGLATALRAGKGSRRQMLRTLKTAGMVEALPLWVGTLGDIDDTLPADPGMFDVVIFDEASQINQVRAVTTLGRAKRAVVIGDPRQLRHVSFVSDDDVKEKLKSSSLDPNDPTLHVRRNSLFDVAATAAPVTTLNEHFRSLPHLIEFSNERFYSNALRLMTRRPESERSDIIHVEHLDGARVDGVNRAEVERVRELLQEFAATDRSVIVASPFRAQIDAIEEMLLADQNRDLIKSLDLRLGTVHGVQGAEADVVIISTALGGDEGTRARTFLQDPNLFNVMITRARHEQFLLISAPDDELGKGLLADYVRYAETPPEPNFQADQHPDWLTGLADKIRSYGLKVIPDYRVAGWTIDLVVTDGTHSVAVECRIHQDGPDAHVERHRALRRAGWRILDAHRSAWLAAPDAAADGVANAILAQS